MRILHLIDSGGVYGAERILLYLAREQQRSGHEPFIGSIARPGEEPKAIEGLAASWGLAVQPIRIPRLPTPGVVRTLLDTARGLGVDVLHSHGYKANVLLGPLPRRLRGPMLTTLHGWTAASPLTALWLYERLDRWALRRIDLVVAVTRRMLELPPLRRLDPSRIRVIENGIPPREERLEALAQSNAAPLPGALIQFVRRRPTFVAIGRLSAEKDFASLVKAFARANSSGRHQLLIVGEGPERAALAQQIAALGLHDAVCLGGFVEGADRLLEGAAGFVMSSRTEGLPLVLLEAMQWQVPILATAVGAIPELLQDGRAGTLVPPQDVTALAEGLTALMGASGSASGSVALTLRYSSTRMAAEYLCAYEAMT